MADISAQAVRALRELTDLPMMECKKALVEADGDQQKAVEILKESYKKVQLKRQDNPTEEGRIFLEVTPDGTRGAMVEVQCESAPVAKSEDFVKLGEQLVKQQLNGPGAETPDDLLVQTAPDYEGTALKDLYEDAVNRIREKIVVSRVTRLEGAIGGYVHHDGKQACLFQAEGEQSDDPILRDVAMHVVAMKSAVCRPEDLDGALVQAEKDRLTEEAKATGKPENIIGKIVEGRMKNFYLEQGVLSLQPFVKEESKTVSQVLAEKGLKPVSFVRWVIGN